MVGPAAKRAAVTHLQAVESLSERRPCSIVSANRKMIRHFSSRPPEAELGAGCEISPTSAGISANAGCPSCCGGRPPSGINRIYRLYREEEWPSGSARRKAWGPGSRSWWRSDSARALLTASSLTAGASTSSLEQARSTLRTQESCFHLTLLARLQGSGTVMTKQWINMS